MQILMEYSQEEIDKVKTWFPGLDYYPDNNRISGSLAISACCYKEKKCENFIAWEIQPCSPDQSECITGEYLIEIDLGQEGEYPKVYEIGEKIERLANELKKRVIDLHSYPQDKSCCLGISFSPRTSLSEFILYDVYPYFVWQAYYYKYKKIPPCGEYSHGIKGWREATEDYKKKIQFYRDKIVGKTGRNNPCPCGSNKKYKKCCLFQDEEYEREVNRMQKILHLQTRKIEEMEQNDKCATMKLS